MLHWILAFELIIKDLFHRQFNYKPISCLTDILFYQNNVYIERFFFLNYEKTKVLDTKNKFKLQSHFFFNDFEFKIDFTSKYKHPNFLRDSVFFTFFLNKKLTILKDGFVIFKNGKKENNFESYETEIQNTIFFLGEELKNVSLIKK